MTSTRERLLDRRAPATHMSTNPKPLALGAVTGKSVEDMSFAEVQDELRPLTGTPYRSEADRLRRQTLWRRIDELTRKADPNFTHREFGPPCEIRAEHQCAVCGGNAHFGIGGEWFCRGHWQQKGRGGRNVRE